MYFLEKEKDMRNEFNSQGFFRYTNTVFLYPNMAAVTSGENDQYLILISLSGFPY